MRRSQWSVVITGPILFLIIAALSVLNAKEWLPLGNCVIIGLAAVAVSLAICIECED